MEREDGASSLRSRRFHVDRHLVIHTNCKNKGKTVKERNVLEIEVKLPGIVSKFKEEVFKCCALFWDTSLREKWISAADGSGSDGSWVCLCKDIKFDPNVSKMVGLEVLPAPFKGLYNSGLFVTQNDHPFESKTVLVFGWGSKARPQTTARSHLNREVVQKELGRIVTHPASDEERDRAKDCLSYLISGKPEGADSKLLWTKQVGWWENSLQTKDLYRLLGYDPKTLFVCKPDGPLSEWALKMANVLAIHTKPQYFEKYANPAFQCLEKPKSANIELFPQMNDKELMQKVYDMIDKEAEFLEDLREIDSTEIYISNFEPTQVTVVISYPPFIRSEPRLSTMVESAAVKMLCLATLWMRKRVRSVLDMDRNPVNLGPPRTKKILHICSPHAKEGMAFYVDGSVLVVVTPLLGRALADDQNRHDARNAHDVGPPRKCDVPKGARSRHDGVRTHVQNAPKTIRTSPKKTCSCGSIRPSQASATFLGLQTPSATRSWKTLSPKVAWSKWKASK